MKRWRAWAAASSLLLLLGGAGPGTANGPLEQIRETTDKILDVVKDPALKGPDKAAERAEKIRALADERFDWHEMSRLALGRYWRDRTPAERKGFTDLFGRLVENTYMDKVEGYSGELIRYTGERVDGKYATVNVVIVTRKNVDIPVEYRLMLEGTKWFVYDVLVEGVSLVNNYRSQFDEILTNQTFQELMQRLEAKVKEGEPSPGPG